MQQESQPGVWGAGPEANRPPPGQGGGAASALWRLAIGLFRFAAILMLFSIGLILAPRLAILAVFVLIGVYVYRTVRKR